MYIDVDPKALTQTERFKPSKNPHLLLLAEGILLFLPSSWLTTVSIFPEPYLEAYLPSPSVPYAWFV